jgi:4-amino-4-deoxy-L-arabinose transferase-like glycosyltransferase
MVGWIISGMRWALGDATWALRIPAVLLPLLLGGILWWALNPLDRDRAAWAVLLFWLAPVNWLNTMITTDTPLIFWSVLSVAALLRAEQRERMDASTWRLYAFAGLFLGFAFLSKYFSVVLGLTYFVYFVFYRRERMLAFMLLVICALPGPVINLAYNISHGWSNIMFNVYNRNEGAAFAIKKPAMYAAMLLYLITPGVAWVAWQQRGKLMEMGKTHRLLVCIVLVPLGFFALLSLKKVIGLHWVLSFYPFGFALLALTLTREKLLIAARGMFVFLGLHLLVVLVLYTTALYDWNKVSLYPEIVQSYRTAEMLNQVRVPGTVLMANSYSPASIYGYAQREYVPVFGPGDFHARQDDMLVDFSLYQGKTIRILHLDPPKLEDFKVYFDSVQLLTFLQDGATFYAVEGRGFNYPAYRDGVLQTAYRQFYNIPSWLPMKGCPFCERLCGKVRCQN